MPGSIARVLVVALGTARCLALFPTGTAAGPALPRLRRSAALLGVPHSLNVLSICPSSWLAYSGSASCCPSAAAAFSNPAKAVLCPLLHRRRPHRLWLGLLSSRSTNDRLLWDRLPMSVAFMALFAAVIGERINAAPANPALPPSPSDWPACSAGMRRKGPARATCGYYLVQFFPMRRAARPAAAHAHTARAISGCPWPLCSRQGGGDHDGASSSAARSAATR